MLPKKEHDPQEDDPVKGEVIRRVRESVLTTVRDEYRRARKLRAGSCHVVWKRAKEILLREHGIDWKTPQEMNLHTRFD